MSEFYDEIMASISETVLECHKIQNYEQWQQDYYDNMALGEFHKEAVKYAKEHPFKGKAQKL